MNVGDKNESNINVNKYITNKKTIMINFTIYATVYTKELKDIINNASYWLKYNSVERWKYIQIGSRFWRNMEYRW